MVKNYFTLLLCLVAGMLSAQLTNNGATIVIEDGATLVVEGDVMNTGSGTISNSGTLDVKGNLNTAAGTLTSTATNAKIIFSGSTGLQSFTLGSPISVKAIDVIGTSGVSLAGNDLTMEGLLNFDSGSGNFNIGSSNLIFGADATSIMDRVDGTSGYVQADGTGRVSKNYNTVSTFEFLIGDADEYSPITIASVPTGENGIVSVAVEDAVASSLPSDVTDNLTRNWKVENSGFATFSGSATGTFVPATDVTGMIGLIKGASLDTDASVWSYAMADGDGTNTVSGDISELDDVFTGTNFFGKANLKIFLQGAYSGGTMSTLLNSGGHLPLISPYDATVSVTSIPNANITDWIEIEVRDPVSPGTILSKHSAFLRNDGVILDLDGNVSARMKDAAMVNAIIGVKHRNHLTIRTPDATSLNLGISSPGEYDFSTSLAQAYDNAGITSNSAMIDLGGGSFGMHRANANGDNNINIVDNALTRINSNPIQSNVYLPFDVNLDGIINIVDNALTRISSNPIKSAHQ